MAKIGFSGAHRTGKTTLCELLAEKHPYVMKKTDIASTFKKEKFTVLANMVGFNGFVLGCEQQWKIIHHLAKTLIKAKPNTFFDRTLLDSFAYTDFILGQRLSEFHATKTEINEFNSLRNACIERFVLQDFTFIIQPGIPFVGVEKSPDETSQEIINTLVIMAAEEYLEPNRYFIMPREVTDLNERIKIIEDVLRVKKYI